MAKKSTTDPSTHPMSAYMVALDKPNSRSLFVLGLGFWLVLESRIQTLLKVSMLAKIAGFVVLSLVM